MIKITLDDGTDVTEAVQALYDLALSALDYGSGVLDDDEASQLAGLAILAGWQAPPLPSTGPWPDFARRHPEAYAVEPWGVGVRVRALTVAERAEEAAAHAERQAVAAAVWRGLSGKQRDMLLDAYDHGDPFRGVHGRAAQGGATGTLASLQRRGLMRGHDLTAPGRDAAQAGSK